MSQVDDYLESLHEGKVWDKAKQVWRDHKGKILAGAGILAAGAAAKAGKNLYDKTPTGQRRIAKKAAEAAEQKKKDDEIVARLRKQDAERRERNSKIGASLAMAGNMVKNATAPARWVTKKAADTVGSGIKYTGNKIANSIKDKVRDTGYRIKYRDRLK